MTSQKFQFEKVFTVLEDQSGLRLDRFVQEALQSADFLLSRSKVNELIESGHILVSGKSLKSSSKVKNGSQVSVRIPLPTPSDLVPLDFPIKILFEDEHCLVVHKPAGLVVHPAAGHAQDTLVNALLHKVRGLKIGFKEMRPGIVHRLDKDTSGILVVAKTDLAIENLSQQFKEKSVHRIYYALVYGQMKLSAGKIETLLERHPLHRKKFHSGSRGKLAITHYKTLKESRGISLIQCQLETGRTHQIRVHLSERDCPIVADPIYSTPRRMKALSGELIKEIQDLKGIGLHARELGFKHPKSNEFLLFKEDWPDSLTPLVKKLGFSDV